MQGSLKEQAWPMARLTVVDQLLSAGGFSASLFLFLPLVVYVLNLAEVTTPLATILLGGLRASAAATALLFLMMRLPGLRGPVDAACRIGILTVVVLTAFPNYTGEVSGLEVSRDAPVDLAAFFKLLAAGGVGAWLAWSKPKVLVALSRCALSVVVLVSAYVAVSTSSSLDRWMLRQPLSGPDRQMDAFTRLGSKQNVIVLIFDGFTGYGMVEVLKDHPELREDLAGFVHYPSALASAISTPAGVSAILTGDLKIALSDEPWLAMIRASLEHSFLSDASTAGLSAGFISHLCPDGTVIPCHPEATFFEPQPVGLMKRLPAYLGFWVTSLPRIVPRSLAAVAGEGTAWIAAPSGPPPTAGGDWDLLQSLRSEDDRRPQVAKMALDHFIGHLEVSTTRGSVLVLHTLMTHNPYRISGGGEYQHDTSTDYAGQALFAVRELARLCAKLRELGAFDSSLIIAVADHGALPIRDRTMGGKHPAEPFPAERLYLNPLLMVKGPGPAAPFRESATTVWLGDVATTVRDFLGRKPPPGALVSSRSLLEDAPPGRTLNMPIFFRPDQLSHYASLSHWTRRDVAGDFETYSRVIEAPLQSLLEAPASVRLLAGVDEMFMNMRRQSPGSAAADDLLFRAVIEVGGRVLTELHGSGIAVLSGRPGNYRTQMFSDPALAEALLRDASPDLDRLVVGLQVPAESVRTLFSDRAPLTDSPTPLNFAAASGPSFGASAKVMISPNEASLDVAWSRVPTMKR